MTDKLKCCFCGAELNDYPDKTTGARMAVCRNPKCKYDGWHFPVDIIQQIIAGKKAWDALKSIADDAFLYHPSVQEEIPWDEHYYRLKNQARSVITAHKDLK